jgi:hypothetical protein
MCCSFSGEANFDAVKELRAKRAMVCIDSGTPVCAFELPRLGGLATWR